MCYSFRTSIFSYVAGLISCIFAFYTKQYILGTLILFYCQMQLAEAMIWKGIDDDNISLNKKGTLYGQYLLPTHVFAVGLGYLIVNRKNLKLKHFIPIGIGLIFYLAIILGPYRTESYEKITYPTDRSCSERKCQNNNNRLVWPFPQDWYIIGFVLCLLFLFIYIKPVSSKILIASFFIGTFLIFFMINGFIKGGSSFWCFSAAILAPILVIANYFLIKKSNTILV